MDEKERIVDDLVGMSIEQALKQVRRDLDQLAKKAGYVPGYRKEIDRALERISAIERYLGINRKIAT